MEVPVTDMQHVNGGYFLLQVHSPAQAALVRPGHFFMLGMQHADFSADPLLNRPISVLDCTPDDHTAPAAIHFLIKEAGRGTRLLSRLRAGDNLLCHGPLGTTFPEPSPECRLILVGGGVGIAPLYFCARRWSATHDMALFYGGRSVTDLPLQGLLPQTGLREVILLTEDGSAGRRGLVTEPLPEYLASNPGAKVYSCGPNAMMEAVARITAHVDAQLWVSMENRMGCGLGACLGCVLPVIEGDKTAMVRICKEGPVFRGEQIDWKIRY
ncbi:MAG: dihydroorotate dehydrogenase electron transfer subunit [Acidobacteria bacterium]|nr:dihydroorotate dehydrogenase electron transfer subunit [Acidobacteriota bacterium]